MCGITDDLIKISPTIVELIFICDGTHVEVYDPLHFTYIANMSVLNRSYFTLYENQVIKIHDKYQIVYCAPTEIICYGNVVTNINNYTIIELIFNNVHFYDVLILVPTTNSLHHCNNYDEIICGLIMLKHNQMVGDIISVIIKLVGFMNILQTYCDNHDKDKGTKCEKFSQDNIENVAFIHVFEQFVHNFIYGVRT